MSHNGDWYNPWLGKSHTDSNTTYIVVLDRNYTNFEQQDILNQMNDLQVKYKIVLNCKEFLKIMPRQDMSTPKFVVINLCREEKLDGMISVHTYCNMRRVPCIGSYGSIIKTTQNEKRLNQWCNEYSFHFEDDVNYDYIELQLPFFIKKGTLELLGAFPASLDETRLSIIKNLDMNFFETMLNTIIDECSILFYGRVDIKYNPEDKNFVISNITAIPSIITQSCFHDAFLKQQESYINVMDMLLQNTCNN